jgi:hypothetical protein
VSTAKRKGDAFERDVARVLREHGHPGAERMLKLGQHRDDGDVALDGYYIECRNRADVAHLSLWLDETVGGCKPDVMPVLIVKRRGRSTEHAYVVCELATFAEHMT